MLSRETRLGCYTTVMTLASAVFQGERPIVDTHCHYNLPPLSENWRVHWEKAQQYGVKAAWIPGTTLESSKVAIDIARQDPNLWALVGVHPNDEETDAVAIHSVVAELETLIERDKQSGRPKIIGIGETGLDYFRIDPGDARERERQRQWFRAQLELAVRHDLFVSLHVRDTLSPAERIEGNAYWDVVEILDSFSALPPVILHCASGPLEYIQVMLDKGAFVSFAGNVTYPKAQAIRDIWRVTLPERRLIETDAPYLAPQAYRGQPCEPWMISATASFLATEAILE